MYKLLTGSSLVLVAAHCAALTITSPQGAVYIGRALDVRIPSKLEADDAVDNLCLKAEVRYGDELLPDRLVDVALSRNGDGSGVLRVRSTRVVNEPIVSLSVQSGCHTSVFRRSFTLLADLDPEIVTPAVSTVTESREPPAQAPAAAPPASPADARPTQSTRTSVSAPRTKVKPASRKVAKSVKAAKKVSPSPVRVTPKPAKEAGARLKLEPIDLSPTAAPATPVATAPAAVPSTVPASVGTPADAADAALLKELQSMRAEQAQMRADMQTLQSRLAVAQQSSGTSPLVYGLSALVALLAAALFWLKRQRDEALQHTAAPIDWSVNAPDEFVANPAGAPAVVAAEVSDAVPGLVVTEVPTEAEALPPSSVSAPASVEVVPVLPAGLPEHQALVSVAEEGGADGPVSVLDWPFPDSTQALDAALLSSAKPTGSSGQPEEGEPAGSQVALADMADAWEQMVFLESIGQADEAMLMAERFVQQHPKSCEGFYLRWLHMAQAQSDLAGIAQATQLYEQHYQRFVPPRASSGLAGTGLELDAGFSQRLAQVWPSTEVPVVLQEALVSLPGEVLAERSLAAFEDLFALYHWWHSLPTGSASARLQALVQPH